MLSTKDKDGKSRTLTEYGEAHVFRQFVATYDELMTYLKAHNNEYLVVENTQAITLEGTSVPIPAYSMWYFFHNMTSGTGEETIVNDIHAMIMSGQSDIYIIRHTRNENKWFCTKK